MQSTSTSEVIALPNPKLVCHVSDVYANELTNKAPERTRAILMEQVSGDYLVSIRVPLSRKYGADKVVSQF